MKGMRVNVFGIREDRIAVDHFEGFERTAKNDR